MTDVHGAQEDPLALVERARSGDLDAFSRLVALYQDRVVAAATGWLRDPELARDVAQEVFWNAHAALSQLDDPLAFGGWLRRIVRKHCDRVTRRGRLEISPRAPEDLHSGGPDAESALATRRAAEQVRRAIEALPERERLPVALHYLAREPQPRIAEFLELPLSTVKKRLRDARARLREAGLVPGGGGGVGQDDEGSDPMPDANDLRPSSDERFSDNVRFYLGLRAGDRREVGRILDQHPELLEAEQSWDPELVTRGVLPYANRATPLITALERGDVAMARLLLERGAAADGRCGCVTGEPPLWAAVVLGELEGVELLLAAGADPNRMAATGNAPLHVAAMRGREDIARRLLAHGADPALEDREGRTAADWAEQKGAAELARTLCEGEPGPGALLSTGIKALDLLAPLPRGGLVRVHFAAGVGMVVLLGELSQRFAGEPGRAALWSGFAQRPFDPVDLQTDLRESGIAAEVGVALGALDAPPEVRRSTFEAGLAKAEAWRDEGRDVLLVLLEETGFEADVAASLARIAAPCETGSITALVVTPPASAARPATGGAGWPARPVRRGDPLRSETRGAVALPGPASGPVLFPRAPGRHGGPASRCDSRASPGAVRSLRPHRPGTHPAGSRESSRLGTFRGPQRAAPAALPEPALPHDRAVHRPHGPEDLHRHTARCDGRHPGGSGAPGGRRRAGEDARRPSLARQPYGAVSASAAKKNGLDQAAPPPRCTTLT